MIRRKKLPMEVRRFKLEEGDSLLLRVHDRLSVADARTIKGMLEDNFPGHKCLVMAGSMELEIVSEARRRSLPEDLSRVL